VRRRFFVEKFAAGHAVMEGEAAHHLGRVLRAQPGQLYELSDGQHVCLARIEKVSREQIEFAIVEELPVWRSAFQATLLLSIVKFDAFEWAIEKATELGVGTIVPLAAARSEKALLAAAAKRSERWKKILLEASQQSRRLRIPTLAQLGKPEAAFAARPESQKILLSERPEAPPLRSSLNLLQESLDFRRPSVLEKNGSKDPPLQEGKSTAAPAATVALAIGPEGGWTESEIEAARAAQFCEASLGQLILRTETAVIAALASLNFALGSE
jgi:16S rRNA (uracil1498-N3)-methyltransferase